MSLRCASPQFARGRSRNTDKNPAQNFATRAGSLKRSAKINGRRQLRCVSHDSTMNDGKGRCGLWAGKAVGGGRKRAWVAAEVGKRRSGGMSSVCLVVVGTWGKVTLISGRVCDFRPQLPDELGPVSRRPPSAAAAAAAVAQIIPLGFRSGRVRVKYCSRKINGPIFTTASAWHGGSEKRTPEYLACGGCVRRNNQASIQD